MLPPRKVVSYRATVVASCQGGLLEAKSDTVAARSKSSHTHSDISPELAIVRIIAFCSWATALGAVCAGGERSGYESTCELSVENLLVC